MDAYSYDLFAVVACPLFPYRFSAQSASTAAAATAGIASAPPQYSDVGTAFAAGDLLELQDPTAHILQGRPVMQHGIGGGSSISIGSRSRLLPVPSTSGGLTANTAVQFMRPPSPGARRSFNSLSMLPPGFSGR